MTLKTELYNFFFLPGTNLEGWPALVIHIGWISSLIGMVFGESIYHMHSSPMLYAFITAMLAIIMSLVAFGAIIFAVTLSTDA